MSKKEKILKKVKKQVKGITLIALVVTIIVLLILAGVAISLTIGSNGIFTRAENAVDRYKIASADEQDEMNNVKIKDRKRRIKQITVTDIVKAFDLQEQLQALCTDTENIEKYESIKTQYKNVPTKKGLKTKLNLEQVLAQSIVEDLKYYLVTNNLFGSLSLI